MAHIEISPVTHIQISISARRGAVGRDASNGKISQKSVVTIYQMTLELVCWEFLLYNIYHSNDCRTFTIWNYEQPGCVHLLYKMTVQYLWNKKWIYNICGLKRLRSLLCRISVWDAHWWHSLNPLEFLKSPCLLYTRTDKLTFKNFFEGGILITLTDSL